MPDAGAELSRRSARAIAILVSCALVATIASLTLGPAGAQQPHPGEGVLWTLSLQGGVDQTRSFDNNEPDPGDRLTWDDTQEYKGSNIRVSFVVNSDGSITQPGAGVGEYMAASWEIQGTNKGQSFKCEFSRPSSMTADPFTPTVSGSTTATHMVVTVDLWDAFESNQDQDCGGDFTAFGGTTQRLRESLDACAPTISLPPTRGHTGNCSVQDSTPQGDIQRQQNHGWTWSLAGDDLPPTESPSPSPPNGSPDPPDGSPSPPDPTASPSPSPSPSPQSFNRAVGLQLRRHLRARGLVASLAPKCVRRVRVNIQRRAGGEWDFVKRTRTNLVGRFNTAIRDQVGRYRAFAPRVMKGIDTCKRGTSPARRHRHR